MAPCYGRQDQMTQLAPLYHSLVPTEPSPPELVTTIPGHDIARMDPPAIGGIYPGLELEACPFPSLYVYLAGGPHSPGPPPLHPDTQTEDRTRPGGRDERY